MSRRRDVSDRIVELTDRIRFGKPISAEILTESLEGMDRLLTRRVRQLADRHKDETGLILAGQFQAFDARQAGGVRPALRVRVGRRVKTQHVSWRLSRSVRTTDVWSPNRFRMRRGVGGLPPRPRWVPLHPATTCLIEMTFSSTRTYEVEIVEFELKEAEKKLIFIKEEPRAVIDAWYEVRDI